MEKLARTPMLNEIQTTEHLAMWTSSFLRRLLRWTCCSWSTTTLASDDLG